MEFNEFKANRLIDFINHIKDNPKQFSKTKYLYILYDNYKKIDSYIRVIDDVIKNINNALNKKVFNIILLPIDGTVSSLTGGEPNHLTMNLHRILYDKDCMLSDKYWKLPCRPYVILNNLLAPNLSGTTVTVVDYNKDMSRLLISGLLDKKATVTICDSERVDLKRFVRQSDIVIFSCSSPKMAKHDWFADGATVIDISENVDECGKPCGDVDIDDILENHTNIKYLSQIDCLTAITLLERLSEIK